MAEKGYTLSEDAATRVSEVVRRVETGPRDEGLIRRRRPGAHDQPILQWVECANNVPDGTGRYAAIWVQYDEQSDEWTDREECYLRPGANGETPTFGRRYLARCQGPHPTTGKPVYVPVSPIATASRTVAKGRLSLVRPAFPPNSGYWQADFGGGYFSEVSWDSTGTQLFFRFADPISSPPPVDGPTSPGILVVVNVAGTFYPGQGYRAWATLTKEGGGSGLTVESAELQRPQFGPNQPVTVPYGGSQIFEQLTLPNVGTNGFTLFLSTLTTAGAQPVRVDAATVACAMVG